MVSVSNPGSGLAEYLSYRHSALIALLVGCNVSSAPSSTGGVDFEPTGGRGSKNGDAETTGTVGAAGAAGELAAAAGAAGASTSAVTCERGVAVVTTDYKSANIAISQLDGTTLSGSFISSGAAKPGLSLAISGDVDVPTVPPASKRVVILDRYGTNVITWMDLATATVIAQLPVGTGFEANPHDYIEVDERRAFVSRYTTNLAPGVQSFDRGGDILILDTTTPAIIGSIPMPEADTALMPRPSGMNWIGQYVAVTLERTSADYATIGDGRFAGVSPATDAIAWTVELAGLKACGRVAVSPSRRLAAIACSGTRDKSTKRYDTSTSDIVIFDATTAPPQELRRLQAAVKLSAGIQPAITFATESMILAKSYGGNATAGDTAFAVSVTTGDTTLLAETTKPYVLWGLHCSPGCGDVCIMSDGERSKLRRWSVSSSGSFAPLEDVTVDTVIGLPPGSMGGV